MAAGLRTDPLGELKRSPDPLAAVKGLDPPGGEGEKGKGTRGGRREGRERKETGWKWRGRGGDGKGSMHSLRKTTPVIRWLVTDLRYCDTKQSA